MWLREWIFTLEGCPSLECQRENRLFWRLDEQKPVKDLKFCLERKSVRDVVAWGKLESCNKYKPSCNWPIPIILQQVRSCMKQNLDRKTTHKGCDLVNALKDKRLKVKKGTQRTFVRVIYYESCIVPMWVTTIASPLGNSTIVCEILL